MSFINYIWISHYFKVMLTDEPFLEIATLSSLANQPSPKSAKFPLRSNSFFILANVDLPLFDDK